jgi:hypothetical protein
VGGQQRRLQQAISSGGGRAAEAQAVDGEASSGKITFDGDGPEIVLSKDSDDCSFRFQHIGLPDSWL